MRKLCVLLAVLFSLALCVEAAAFAEGGASPAADGVWLEYELLEPETDDEERETLFGHWESFLRGRLLEQRYEDVSVIALEGGAGIRVEVPGAADPDTLVAWIGKPPVLSFRYEDGTEFLTSKNVASAGAVYDEWTGYYVALQLDDEGAEILAEATEKAKGHCIGIYIDDTLLMNPRVEWPINGGSIAITGDFTEEEAANMAAQIQAGALPFERTLVRMGTMQMGD